MKKKTIIKIVIFIIALTAIGISAMYIWEDRQQKKYEEYVINYPYNSTVIQVVAGICEYKNMLQTEFSETDLKLMQKSMDNVLEIAQYERYDTESIGQLLVIDESINLNLKDRLLKELKKRKQDNGMYASAEDIASEEEILYITNVTLLHHLGTSSEYHYLAEEIAEAISPAVNSKMKEMMKFESAKEASSKDPTALGDLEFAISAINAAECMKYLDTALTEEFLLRFFKTDQTPKELTFEHWNELAGEYGKVFPAYEECANEIALAYGKLKKEDIAVCPEMFYATGMVRTLRNIPDVHTNEDVYRKLVENLSENVKYLDEYCTENRQ